MKKQFTQLLRYFLPLFTIFIICVVLVAFHDLLRHYHYKDIVHSLRQLPPGHIGLALLFTVASYLLLTLYDTLGVRSIEHPLPYHRIALASFIGYTFNNNLGFAGLGGNALRYRIYTSWGLSAVEVAKVIAFCVLTFWLGFLAVAGVSFLADPIPLPTGLAFRGHDFQINSLRPLGVLLLVPVTVYLFWSAARKDPIKFRDWQMTLPPLKISLAQICAAALDWAAAAAVFFILLPVSGHVSYAQVIGLFLLAQIMGLLSHVPGGVGVFEYIMIISLTEPHSVLAQPFDKADVLGSLLAYRAIYYLLPLGTAVVMLGAHEITLRLERVRRTVRLVGQWVPALIPNVFAFAVFIAGALLLFSGATPSVYDRLTFLHHYIPYKMVEAAHLLSSMTGAALLLLARGLQRRLDSAYLVTVILLAAGIVFNLGKGLNYEEACVLLVILLAFIPCRAHFYRKASLLSRYSISAGWAVAIALTLIGSIWVGLFSFKQVTFSSQLWLHFGTHTARADASKFLRATVGAIGVVALYGLKVLLRPAPPEAAELTEEDWRKVRTIVERSPRTQAWSALLRDKHILLNTAGSAFIMYGVEGRSWVALGDPVGPDEDKDELAWQFRELSDAHGGWTVFYHVTPEHLPLYLDLGLVLLKLGEEAMVPLETFSLEGSARKNLRGSHNKIAHAGYRFEVLPREAVPALLPRLREISDAWLAAKNTREKGFSLGYFSEAYLAELPLAVVRDAEGAVVAFANVWPGAQREELSIDMMRYVPEFQGGIMDYLFVELMLYGKAQGYRWFNLGMAPLSGLDSRALAPLWTRIGAIIFRHGEHFYNFKGLRRYKEKFEPVWVPKYLASPGGIALPRILTNIASLISHGMRGLLGK